MTDKDIREEWESLMKTDTTESQLRISSDIEDIESALSCSSFYAGARMMEQRKDTEIDRLSRTMGLEIAEAEGKVAEARDKLADKDTEIERLRKELDRLYKNPAAYACGREDGMAY